MSYADSSMDAILAKLAAMQATLDGQQAAIVALQQENAQLHAALDATLSATLSAEPATPDAISPATPVAAPELIEAAGDSGAHESQPRAGLTSRRGLLRGAAAATAAATVGVAALGATQPVHAAPLDDGGNLIIGQNNTELFTTSLTSISSTLPALFQATTSATGYHSAAIYGLSQNGASGVMGVDQSSGTNSQGTGVYGYSSNMNIGTGVRGETASGGAGVHGAALDGNGLGTGVYGAATRGYGVSGFSTYGWGVVGESFGGYDIVALGTGIVGVQVQTYVGAPQSGSYTIGDAIRDANGDLWLCMLSGNPGTWVKVSHPVAGLTGGATTYLPKPIRLLDTRQGQSALNHPNSPYAAGSTHTITVAGASFNGVTVPASCAGAIGNLTVIGGAGSGNYVALVPSGAGFSGTANLAFTAGQVVSNAYNVGLNSAGALDIILGGGGTSNADVILDLFAVVS